jgi:hypothetical protein
VRSLLPPRNPLNPLLPQTLVWAVQNYTGTISRNLPFVKVSILRPEYLEDLLGGGPSHEPRAPHLRARRDDWVIIHWKCLFDSTRSEETKTCWAAASITGSSAMGARNLHEILAYCTPTRTLTLMLPVSSSVRATRFQEKTEL